MSLSNWIGWPGSPGTLSVTLLTTSKKPPFSFLISIADWEGPGSAAFLVFASWIVLIPGFDVLSTLITKYKVLSLSIPSGV